MTAEELVELLQKEHPNTELFVCHWAKRAGRARPIIFPLAELKHRDGQLCLVEEDDLKLYLADR